jgi:hypothetical protein
MEWFGERTAMTAFRRHASWYTKGFPMTSELRAGLMQVATLAQLAELFAAVDRSQPFPPSAVRVPRGKTSAVQKVALPQGYLDNIHDATPPFHDADEMDSGGG